MKKITFSLLMLVLLLTLVGCGHKHEYSEEVVEATCTEGGYTKYTCECGDTYNDNEVEAKGHSYGDWTVVKEATEDEEGLKESVCSVCNQKGEEKIAKLDHTHKYTDNVVEATCTEDGYTEHICACGDKYTDSEVKAGHKEEVLPSKAATCTEEGLTEGKKCSKCDEVLVEQTTIPSTGHTEEVLPAKETSCAGPGLTEGKKCSVCGAILVEQNPIDALDHSYGDWVTIKEPTGIVKGLKERSCTACGNKESETLPIVPLTDGSLYVGEGYDYATLDEAITNAPEGSTIILLAGEYSLSVKITKSVTILGPNMDLKVSDEKNDEAVINVAKDVAGNLAAKNIIFNGVHVKGTGGGAGIPGVSFQDGGNIEKLVFKSCELSDTNTLLKFVGGESNLELLFEDCYIHTIGQFVLWTTTAINKTILKGNYVDGSTCGAVTNANAALFRIRFGALEAYNNVFNGDSMNEPGYFECSALDSVVKYNTFKNVTKYVFSSAEHKVTFNENLYLDANGTALTAAHEKVTGTGVVADTKVAKDAEELKQLYENYLGTLK